MEGNDEHEEVLRRLNACAKAQKVFSEPESNDDAVNWGSWEKERAAEYKRLGGSDRTLMGDEEAAEAAPVP